MAENPFRGHTDRLTALQHLSDDVGGEERIADRLLDAVFRYAIFVGDFGIGLAGLDPVEPAERRGDVFDKFPVQWLRLVPEDELRLHTPAAHGEPRRFSASLYSRQFVVRYFKGFGLLIPKG